ncbi:phospho-N-acetylmuramoyl-pentapeptide-transferase [Ruminococcaceae bacterium FB2012]|nr:phospho-N-acetylmuramoyl-pentapeptide-transferase [Ruminococcaceae bacterium FB2012]
MLYHFWKDDLSMPFEAILLVCTFVLAFAGFKIFAKMLPRDHGREFAVNGELSQGKPRGAGIILVTVFTLCTALFAEMSVEMMIYLALIYGAMLTGFLDDAAKVPWGELKKGLLDLVISAGTAVTFAVNHSTKIGFFSTSFTIPMPVYIILATGLVWMSINVVNCSDGVDGLCGTLSMISIFLFTRMMGLYGSFGVSSAPLVMLAVLAAYLWFNCSPSQMLMGDAGSRALGVFIAIMAMQSGRPFLFIPFVLVMILDGGLGLVKLSVRRLTHSTTFMDGIRTPLHDHARKLKGWSDTQVVIRFALIQLILGATVLFMVARSFF